MTFLLLLGTAHAFSMPGHRAMTERTVEVASLEEPAVAAALDALVAADLAEDLDLITKWGRYSHYYDPTQPVEGLRRASSAERVAMLELRLDDAIARGDADLAWRLAGHLLHHVQDMASPPHVLPVVHGLSDGFESQEVGPWLVDAGRQPLPPLSGSEAHEGLALETISRVNAPHMPTWWVDEPGSFGTYGPDGNVFGAAEDPEEQRVAEALLADRIDAAVRYGAAFLVDTAERLEAGPMLAGSAGTEARMTARRARREAREEPVQDERLADAAPVHGAVP